MMLVNTTAPSSGKAVTLNLSPDRCIIFDFTTMEELSLIINEHQKQKIANLWNGTFSKVSTEDGITFLEAFRCKKDQGLTGSTFFNIKNELIKKALLNQTQGAELKGAELVNYVQSLPIERQRHLLELCHPTNRTELEETVRLVDARFGSDKLVVLRTFSTPEEFVNHAARKITDGYSTKKNESYDYFNILVKLWANGLILFPQNLRIWEYT